LDCGPVGGCRYHPLAAHPQLRGCDVYIDPHAGNQNAGYTLVDLDRADPTAVGLMRANGDDPVWWYRPAPAICSVGFASAPLRWSRHRVRQADNLALRITQLPVEDLPGVGRCVGSQHRERAKGKSGQGSEESH
jgi:hypothetical protein